MRSILALTVLFLAGCSHEEMRQTHEDARKLGQDIKKEFKTADTVVTKDAKEARQKVKEEAAKVKKDLHKDQ